MGKILDAFADNQLHVNAITEKRTSHHQCSRIRTAICVCAGTVAKHLLQAGRGMNFAARGVRTNITSINQEIRKRGTNRIITKKCLRHSGDCDILNIKKDICANRCPTGATDRRLARLISYSYSRILWSGGRLFLCLIIIFAADGVSETETGQA